MNILNLNMVAKRIGCSRRNIERLISVGEGPTVTRLSPRRIGVAETDLEQWLLSRRRPSPASAASASPQAA